MKFKIDNSFFLFLNTGKIIPRPTHYYFYENSSEPKLVESYITDINNSTSEEMSKQYIKSRNFWLPLLRKIHQKIKSNNSDKVHLDGKIKSITAPFIEKYIENFSSIVKLSENEDIDYQSNAFIINFINKPTIYIYFQFKKDSLLVCEIDDYGLLGYYYFEWNDLDENPDLKYFEGIISNKPIDSKFTLYDVACQHSISLAWFLKYCKTETKILPPKSKQKIFNTKYLNDTNQNIEIIDSTWFTTLIQSNAFKVRGHFRLQPCGHNLSERKIIWINDYQKHGYIRKYKKEDINLESEYHG